MAAPLKKCLCKRRVLTLAARRLLQALSRPLSSNSLAKQNIDLILKTEPLCESKLSVDGWVKSIRQHKDLVFLHISDGSGPQLLQVVAAPRTVPSEVTFGSCVHLKGELKKSPGKGQNVELVASSVTVHGACDALAFPFGVRHKHSADYCREFLHLRPKTDTFASLLRIRSAASAAFHKYFQDRGYLFVHTPILTSNDCEGGGEVFAVEPAGASELNTSGSESDIESGRESPSSSESERKKNRHFFSHPTYLTVSGQLHLEAIAGAFSKVYSFGPTFRAENSRGRHHLSEFYMIEAEVSFLHSLDDLILVMEQLVQQTLQHLLTNCQSELAFYFKRQENSQQQDFLQRMATSHFARISYGDAIKILESHNEQFMHKVKWGCDLQKEHEKFLTAKLGGVPVFVTDFPAILKPFYAKANSDEKTVGAVDLLVPGVGELIGGSLREDNADVLTQRLQSLKVLEQMAWYLELRKFGSSPHGGFGLGFERFLQFALGIANIKDTIPFPRWPESCRL